MFIQRDAIHICTKTLEPSFLEPSYEQIFKYPHEFIENMVIYDTHILSWNWIRGTYLFNCLASMVGRHANQTNIDKMFKRLQSMSSEFETKPCNMLSQLMDSACEYGNTDVLSLLNKFPSILNRTAIYSTMISISSSSNLESSKRGLTYVLEHVNTDKLKYVLRCNLEQLLAYNNLFVVSIIMEQKLLSCGIIVREMIMAWNLYSYFTKFYEYFEHALSELYKTMVKGSILIVPYLSYHDVQLFSRDPTFRKLLKKYPVLKPELMDAIYSYRV